VNWKGLELHTCGLINILCRYFPGGTKENHEHLSQGSRCFRRDIDTVYERHCQTILRGSATLYVRILLQGMSYVVSKHCVACIYI
jgi:hypothetical protein